MEGLHGGVAWRGRMEKDVRVFNPHAFALPLVIRLDHSIIHIGRYSNQRGYFSPTDMANTLLVPASAESKHTL